MSAIGYEEKATSSSTITLRVYVDPAQYQYYRLFIRKTSASVATQTDFRKTSGTYFDHTFTGLDANTSYTVNMHFSTVSDHTDGDYAGASVIWTDEPSSKKAWIYTSDGWKEATAWIYTSDGWKEAEPHIYDGGWK